MSKINPAYQPIIAWLNSLPKGRIFTKQDAANQLKEIPEKYLNQVIASLASKEFYIGKNFNEKQKD